MKPLNWLLTTIVAATLVLTGCSKSDQQTQLIDTASVEKSFASAEPTLKASAQKVVSEIKAGNYQAALQELKTLGANAKLTEEQKNAITKIIADVQKAITGAIGKATGQADKALDDAQKTLGK